MHIYRRTLSHSGKKGMKWGYNDGKPNGKRTAEDGYTDEDFKEAKKITVNEIQYNNYKNYGSNVIEYDGKLYNVSEDGTLCELVIDKTKDNTTANTSSSSSAVDDLKKVFKQDTSYLVDGDAVMDSIMSVRNKAITDLDTAKDDALAKTWDYLKEYGDTPISAIANRILFGEQYKKKK